MLLLADSIRYKEWFDRAAAKFNANKHNAVDITALRNAELSDYMMAGSSAIIQVTGPLTYKYDFYTFCCDGSSYQGLSVKFAEAERNPECKRIVMVFDTPGGEVTGLPEFARQIRNCSKEVVAVVDPCAASAGLWLATQAKKIICIESGEVGSLGVQCSLVSYAKMFEAEGVEVAIIRSDISPDKNLGHPHEPLDEECKQYMQSRVDKMAQVFLSDVCAGRGCSPEYAKENFGKGRMLDCEEALKVGLIDSVGSLASVLTSNASSGVSARRRSHARLQHRR